MPENTDSTQPTSRDEQQLLQDWKFSIDGEYRIVDKDRLTELSRGAEVILVNDDHPSSFTHTDWIDLIRELQQNGQNPSLLFEMIKDDYQAGLTAFANGEMSEQQFLNEVYNKSWDWDYRRYVPYFRLVQELRIPAVAADLNRDEQAKYSDQDQPVQTYAGTRLVSSRTHQRDIRMTTAIEQERERGRKPVLLVGGAHFGNQVNLLTEKYGIVPEKVLLLSEYVDGQHNSGFIEFKPAEGKPARLDRIRPQEKR